MKVSIITVNRNNAAGLERTISSVVSQTSKDFEYIVIDGNSSDDSVDKITPQESHIAFWVSEPDTGIYNAMNKGIKKATGDYCLFLNSGDWLVDNDTIAKALERMNEDADVYYGRRINYYGENDISMDTSKHSEITPLAFLDHTPSHQCSFIRTQLLRDAGMYRENFRINSDWFFFLDVLVNKGAVYKYFDIYVSYYDMHGTSSQDSTEILRKKEREAGIDDIFGINASLAHEVLRYHESEYFEITNRWGETRFLITMLKVYKFLARRLKFLQKV